MAREPLSTLHQLGGGAYLVGGAVRDELLGRPTSDYDVAVRAEPRAAARELGRALCAHVFELSEGFGAWRAVARDRSWQVDVLPLSEGRIEVDLGRRDLTINAIAQALGGGELIDPYGGRADLERGLLRMVSPAAFADDPLRVLRLARLACELDFEVEAQTMAAARAQAHRLSLVAPERVFTELKRVIVSERALSGLALLDDLDGTAAVLPELSALRGVSQSDYHHLDVHEHTRAVLAATIELQRDPAAPFAAHADALERFMSEPMANELSRWGALRFGALLHDVAKPQTRAITAEGRTTFMGHDVEGAEVAARVLARLRSSQRLGEHVAALVRHHLRLGFLVHQAPLGPRAVYRYLRACEPVAVDVTVLSVADRLATRGRGAEQAIERHLALAGEILPAALRWERERPRPPVRGDELVRELGMHPDPRLGRILEQLEEDAYAGEIGSRAEALARAQALGEGEPAGER